MPIRKQTALSYMRHLGLLPLLERARFWLSARRARRENAVFLKTRPDVALPPLYWMHDMYAHCAYAQYWQTGKEAAAFFAGKIAQHATVVNPAIAEWGCGMGRILRHMPQPDRTTGFDYNSQAIDWCKEHLSGAWHKNEVMPPLPQKEHSFDAVFAVSVFTHLSAKAHQAWADEIIRVLKPGGIFMPTFHGNPRAGQLLPDEQALFDKGHLVTRGNVKEGSRIYVAFHPEKYIKDILLRRFEIIEGAQEKFGQTLYIVRKPRH